MVAHDSSVAKPRHAVVEVVLWFRSGCRARWSAAVSRAREGRSGGRVCDWLVCFVGEGGARPCLESVGAEGETRVSCGWVTCTVNAIKAMATGQHRQGAAAGGGQGDGDRSMVRHSEGRRVRHARC